MTDPDAVEALAARLNHVRRVVSPEGREVLVDAVRIEHDWALPASSVDKQIEALSALSDDDLEAAYLLTQHMTEAIACLQAGEQR
jgi:hypothetical protein